jgi:hypothetical protein
LFQYGATVHAYSPADWETFCAAIAGAAAALTGLLFVAVSINLDRILVKESMLPARATCSARRSSSSPCRCSPSYCGTR